MTTRPPPKPYQDFPLTAHAASGQWKKDVWNPKLRRAESFYFGRWADDPRGERALADWRAREPGIRSGLDRLHRDSVAPGALTASELMQQFLSAKLAQLKGDDLSAATYADYAKELPQFVNFIGSGAEVARLKPADFARYNQDVLIAKRQCGRHARARVIRYIRAMFNWASSAGHLPKINFGPGFQPPDTSKAALRRERVRLGQRDYSDRIATGEEIDKLLARARPLLRAMILLGVNCGLGPADIGRMRWYHVDLVNRKIVMPRGKTGAERPLYLWRRTVAALERVRTLKHCRLAIQKGGENALVFLTRMGRPVYEEGEKLVRHKSRDGNSPSKAKKEMVRRNSISITFGRMVRELGLDGLTFYRLRHTFKTLGKKARDPEALNLMMGHVDRSIGRIYDHEEIGFARCRRVAKVVYRRLWPRSTGTEQGRTHRSSGEASVGEPVA